jgi:RNA polymerase sigma-70 factor (ECF subfamily)
MVDLRLHERLRPRLSPSDVMQEAFLDALKKLPSYLRNPRLPVFLWLRRVTADKLHDLHRHHLEAKVRDARREVSLAAGLAGPEASSVALAAKLARGGTSPSEAARDAELRATLEAALGKMDGFDREIVALRCFEGLTSKESAQVLGIEEAAARQRYFRALRRLKGLIGGQLGPE